MAREQFIDNLRRASRLLAPPDDRGDSRRHGNDQLSSVIESADLWLTRRAVEGFDPADFADWPKSERETLIREVAAFRQIAEKVPADKPATKTQARQARRHLDRIIELVRGKLLPEWLQAQEQMLQVAEKAAQSQTNWYLEKDDKQVVESLLGSYRAPRLRVRTPDSEVVFDPVARFGSGRQGIVDLLVLPTYETAYYLTYRQGQWEIVSAHGSQHRRPFNTRTLLNTLSRLSRI